MTIRTIDDLTPDDKNANKGTDAGKAMLKQSLADVGATRGVFADKNGKIIGGNKTVEAAKAAGLEIIVVPSDGSALVVVQRNDLDLDNDDGRARAAAYYDNRTSELDLNWDRQQLLEDAGKLDLKQFWDDNAFAKLMVRAPLPVDLGSPKPSYYPSTPPDDDGASDDDDTYEPGEPDNSIGGSTIPAPPAGISPVVHVRMVQLFLNTETFPEFQEITAKLAAHFNTSNPTDTVMEALRLLASLQDAGDLEE